MLSKLHICKKEDAIRKAVAACRSKVTKALPKQQFNSSRVIDLSKLAVNIQKITSHSASCGGSCTVDGKIYRAGLASIIQVTCTKCDTVFHIKSSSRFTDKSGKKHWTVNLGAVLGQMAIGGGASHLMQTMTSLGTLSMSKHTFTSTERYLSEEIEKMLAKSMIEAGKKEREHAIANNRYFQGVPAITVIADGGWSKRCHKHSYNAKSGVAVIIGQHTKKLLYVLVKAWVRVHYWIYLHELPVSSRKIEHEAEGRVLYFSRRDQKRVRINPIVHEGAMALIDL